jgi:hypothetical protein
VLLHFGRELGVAKPVNGVFVVFPEGFDGTLLDVLVTTVPDDGFALGTLGTVTTSFAIVDDVRGE